MLRATATILLLAAVAGLAAADTTGTRFEGYTYVSDKTGYVNMTLDYCDISVGGAGRRRGATRCRHQQDTSDQQ